MIRPISNPLVVAGDMQRLGVAGLMVVGGIYTQHLSNDQKVR
jgi:hypothetical protein